MVMQVDDGHHGPCLLYEIKEVNNSIYDKTVTESRGKIMVIFVILLQESPSHLILVPKPRTDSQGTSVSSPLHLPPLLYIDTVSQEEEVGTTPPRYWNLETQTPQTPPPDYNRTVFGYSPKMGHVTQNPKIPSLSQIYPCIYISSSINLSNSGLIHLYNEMMHII